MGRLDTSGNYRTTRSFRREYKSQRAFPSLNKGSSFSMEFDQAALASFEKFLLDYGPKEGQKAMKAAFGTIGTNVVKRMRPRYSKHSDTTLGLGTGKKYGHTRDGIFRTFGAKKFGGFTRIHIEPDVEWKAYINEYGSFRVGDRYQKPKVRKYEQVSILTQRRRKSDNSQIKNKYYRLVGKGKYTGKLPARPAWQTGVRSISLDQQLQITARAIDRAIAAGLRRAARRG